MKRLTTGLISGVVVTFVYAEIFAGEDCNGNGVSDQWEIGGSVHLEQYQYNFAYNAPFSVTWSGLPTSDGDIRINAEAVADINCGSEYATVLVDGTKVGTWCNGLECPGTTHWGNDIFVDAALFNDAVADDQSIVVAFIPSGSVGNICGNDRITVHLWYQSALVDEDCDGNGVVDACDEDCNDNAIPDACEEALPDCDANGTYDVCDILNGTVEDCNENGLPDSCDIDSGSSSDVNLNDIPDECECLGDVTLDGTVDVTDMLTVIATWGTTGPLGDANLDGTIDIADLLFVLSTWGPCP